MKGVATAWARALRAGFSPRMMLLSLAPLLLSLLAWGGLLWAFGPALFDWLQGVFTDYGWFQASGSLLSTLGLGMLKVVVVPLVAILLLLPLMIASSLLFMGIFAMPAIENYVSRRQYPKLERKAGTEGGRQLRRQRLDEPHQRAGVRAALGVHHPAVCLPAAGGRGAGRAVGLGVCARDEL
jgi:hypothetical protein